MGQQHGQINTFGVTGFRALKLFRELINTRVRFNLIIIFVVKALRGEGSSNPRDYRIDLMRARVYYLINFRQLTT